MISRIAFFAAALGLGFAAAIPASAQNSFRTPNGTVVPGEVPLSQQGTDNNGNLVYGPSPGGGLNVGGKTVQVCTGQNGVPAITVTASNSYGTNYVVGNNNGVGTALIFPNAFTATGSGILQAIAVTIKDQETSGFTFVPFNANPLSTTWTDAAVSAINAADVPKVRGPVPLANNIQLAATLFSVQYAYGIGLPLAPGITTLYGLLLANAALTNQFAGTSDVQVCVVVLDDE